MKTKAETLEEYKARFDKGLAEALGGLSELVEAGIYISVGGGYYEDMGGHVIHESQIDVDAEMKELENE